MKKFSPLKLLVYFLALTFIIHQLVSIFYKPISTQSATFYNATDGLEITGVIIRNETFIKSNKDGVLHFLVPDGSRVSKDGVIANIFNNEDASITLNKIDSVKEKINDIEDILSKNNVNAADFDVANANVDNKLNSLILSSSFGNFSGITDESSQLLNALNKRQAILGETTDFKYQLSILNAELSNLEDSLSDPIGKIKSSQSGYFISKTDGYENSLKIDDLTTITPQFLNNLKKNATDSNVIGKIVSDYEWYIAANVSLTNSLNYKIGDNLTIYTETVASPKLSVTVKNINLSKDGTDAVIIFACSDMNSELATMRTGAMTVVKHEYSGLRIPKKALRFIDSKPGVFVVSGMQVKFKEVKIIYNADDFVICEKNESSDSLRLYDQVVVKGKNLKDGKIIS